MTEPAKAALGRIKEAVGAKVWTDDAAQIEPYLIDSRGVYRGATPLLVRPRTAAEVCEIVRLCAEARIAIVPQGGNTGRVGGAVPSEAGDEIVLSLSRLSAIRSVDVGDEAITVEAGCVLSAVQEAADKAGRLFPLSLASEGTCQIGGTISTNAGGTAVLRYGMMRELVLGLEVVLPDGRLWDGLRGLRKDNTGYDLKQLFIGAEGTLGIITAAVLRLFPRPRETATALVAVPDVRSALAILGSLREASGGAVSAYELVARGAVELVLRHVPGCTDPMDEPHPWYVLTEVAAADSSARPALEASLASAIEAGWAIDAVLAESGAQAAALWRLRETIPEAETREGASIKHDIAVPPSCVAAFMARARASPRRSRPRRPLRVLRPPGRRQHPLQPEPARGRRSRRFSRPPRGRGPHRLRHRGRPRWLDLGRARGRSGKTRGHPALQVHRRDRANADHQDRARSAQHHEPRQVGVSLR